MDTLQDNAEDLVAHVAEYLDTQKKLLVLNVAEKTASTISSSVSAIVLAVTGLLALVFLSIALGFYLGTVWDNYALGFLCIGAVYLFLMFVFQLNKKSLVQDKVTQSILQNLLQNEK